jgi:hypothetical protein
MEKVAILVASHIRYNKQFIYLKRCIKSLLNQTYSSDILLSVSFENDDYKNRFYDKIKSKYSTIMYYESDNKKSQFQHYDNLKNYIDRYDYILFCEDDDYYSKNRVKKLLNSILTMNNEVNIEYIGCSERPPHQPRNKRFLVGYMSYMLKPVVFKKFFSILYEKNMTRFLELSSCWILFNNYLQIILNTTNRIYYLDVNNMYYYIERGNMYSYIDNEEHIDKKHRKKQFIQDDFIECIFGQCIFNLNLFLQHHKIKNNIKNIQKYISMKDYVELKNLVIQYHFIKF